MFKILETGHSKLGAIKSTLPLTFRGFWIDAITQSGLTFVPEKVIPATVEVLQPGANAGS